MNILHREWTGVQRGDVFHIIPLGDVHLGNAACDEKLFQQVVKRIANDPRCSWLGMGDYCEFIQMSDPRWSPSALAPWVRVSHLGDLARAQRDRFLEMVQPIAGRCLGLVEGNHERAIRKYYERDIYLDIVQGVKEMGGFPADHKLALGYYGWLLLIFKRKDARTHSMIRINVHHGFVGGKLAGAKALNMQRWLWTHEADLVIFGHSHNSAAQVETVERVSRAGKAIRENRIGCYSGSFMSGAEYAEQRGYFPLPLGYQEITLRPGAHERRKQVQLTIGQ
jgi:calcineurin-like phosphoesterase family protein